LFVREPGLKTAPQKFRRDNRQVKIKVMGNDRFRSFHIGIELREHLIERYAFGFCPLGRDPVNPGRVSRDGKVRRVNDKTVPAFRDPVAGV